MEFLQSLDELLFHFINVTLSNSITDKVMPFITERNNWFIFYGLIWLYLFIKGGARGRTAAMLILPLILISDQSANLIKPFFQRIRPCNVLQDVHMLINCSDSFAFPSNHAVNNFAAATLFSHFYPGMKYFLFTGAFIVSLSRVMCGVHYPFDIIAGALYGSALALILIYFWKLLNKKFRVLEN